jgi:hypothetical protein
VDGDFECPELGLRREASSPEAAAFGLCSDELLVSIGTRAWRVPPWFTTGAKPLPAGVFAAALASLGHFGAGMGLFLCALGGALVIGVATGYLGLAAVAIMGLVLLGSVLVHEVGHVVAYRLLMGRRAPAVMVVRGASCRLVRLTGTSARDAAVVVAGPIAPVVAALPLWVLFPVAPVPVLLVTLVALGHVVGLVLPAGDGAALRELAGRRAARAE